MKEIDFNEILDQVISSSDKNLSMQAEFLKAIYEIKGKFEVIEKDTTELRKDLESALSNSFDIINLMKSRPNETISSQVEIVQSTLSTFIMTLEKIMTQLENIKTTKQEEDKLKVTVSELERDFKDIATFYKMINKWLIIIGMILLIFQTFFGVLRWREDSKIEKLETQLQKIVEISRKGK